jgi:hypothetical protein
MTAVSVVQPEAMAETGTTVTTELLRYRMSLIRPVQEVLPATLRRENVKRIIKKARD